MSVLAHSQFIYWLGTLLFDYTLYLLQASLMLILVHPLNLDAFTFYYSDYVTLLLSFGLAHLAFSYLLSFLFTAPQSALKAYSMLYLIAGFLVPLLLKSLTLMTLGCRMYHIAEVLVQFIPLNPLYVGFDSIVRKKHRRFFESNKRRQQRQSLSGYQGPKNVTQEQMK